MFLYITMVEHVQIMYNTLYYIIYTHDKICGEFRKDNPSKLLSCIQ